MDIPFDLLHIVASYLVKPKMILLDWVDIDMLDYIELTSNPNAYTIYEILTQYYPEKISWHHISENPNVMRTLENNPDKIEWYQLSRNPSYTAIHMLENNLDKICWQSLSANPSAINTLENNPDKIKWDALSRNPNAIHLLENNPDKINWEYLSGNPNAIHLLEKHPEKICMRMLSSNPCEGAMRLINEHIYNPLSKINWTALSRHANRLCVEKKLDIFDCFNNPCIKHILEANPANPLDDINWTKLSSNPYAFDILEKYPERIIWYALMRNPNINAINNLLNKLSENLLPRAFDYECFLKFPNIDIINELINIITLDPDNMLYEQFWDCLSENPNAMSLLKKYPDRINWYCLSKNPCKEAIDLLKNNPDNIVYESLSVNPSIFEIDTEQLKKDILYKTNDIDNIHC